MPVTAEQAQKEIRRRAAVTELERRSQEPFMPPRFDAPAIADPQGLPLEELREPTQATGPTMIQLQKEAGIYDRPEPAELSKPQQKSLIDSLMQGVLPRVPEIGPALEPMGRKPQVRGYTTPADVRGKDNVAVLDWMGKMGIRGAKDLWNKGVASVLHGLGGMDVSPRDISVTEFQKARMDQRKKQGTRKYPEVLLEDEFEDIKRQLTQQPEARESDDLKEVKIVFPKEGGNPFAVDVPPPERDAAGNLTPQGMAEFIQGTGIGILSFVSQIAILKKMFPQAPPTVIWEAQNIATGGPAGAGAGLRGGLGIIEKIPTITKLGKAGKVGAGGGLYGGITLAQGGSWEEVATNTLLGAGFQAWGIHKQNQFLKRLETQLKKTAYNQVQTNIQKGRSAAEAEFRKNIEVGMEPAEASANYRRALKAITQHHSGQLERHRGKITKVMDLMKRKVHHADITEKLKTTPEELAKEISKRGVTPRAAREAAKIKTPAEKRQELAKKGYPEERPTRETRVVPTTRAAKKAGAKVEAERQIRREIAQLDAELAEIQRPARQAPVIATKPTPVTKKTPPEQISPTKAEITPPDEAVEAKKPRKPLPEQEVTAKKPQEETIKQEGPPVTKHTPEEIDKQYSKLIAKWGEDKVTEAQEALSDENEKYIEIEDKFVELDTTDRGTTTKANALQAQLFDMVDEYLVQEKPPPTKHTPEEIEASDEQLSGISNRRRNRLIKETAKQIAESDIYQLELEGQEDMGAEIGEGYYYVPKNLWTEVQDTIGKKKGAGTKLQRMFTSDPHAKIIVNTPTGKAEIGPTDWASAVQQALGRGKAGIAETEGEMGISEFVRRVKDTFEGRKEIGGLNVKAVEAAEASSDPHIQYQAEKLRMLRAGYSPTEMDDMTRAWAEEYGIDEADIEDEFIGPEPQKIKDIKKLPEEKQDAAIEALARENILKQERLEAKQAVNEVLAANDIEVEVEAVTKIEPKKIQRDLLGKPVETKRAGRLRKMADTLDKHIEDKRREMTQNPTPKRMKEYYSRIHDADNLERTQKAMRAMADALEKGELPAVLGNIKTKQEIQGLVYKGLKGGGYYEVIPSDEYSNTSPEGKALQQLIEVGEAPEAEAKRLERERKQEIKRAEEKFRFLKIKGFFPTPKPVIDEMIERADIEEGMSILEPSAGKGDIADALKEVGYDAEVVEIRPQLQEILRMKGHEVVGDDFLEHEGQYDRILMNPPFEGGQDAVHVQHAYTLLKPGGKIVSIMGEGSFSRSQKKDVAFREWLEEVGGVSEKSEQAFKGKESFRQTGVASRIVEIEKPDDDIPFERRGRPVGAAIITPAGREIVQLAYGADSITGYHEGYHILRGHLTPKDIKVLSKHFKGNTEAEARAFADYAKTGKVKTGYLRNIWRKLVEILKRIKSALQGRGYRTAQDIFGEIRRGKVRKGEFAGAGIQLETRSYDEILKQQRELEGLRAAIRDPKTGKVYTAQTHQAAIDKAPRGEDVWGRLWGEWDKATENSGFVDKNGKFISRSEAERRWDVLTMEDVKDKRTGRERGSIQYERGVFDQPIHTQLRLPLQERQAAIKRVAVQEVKAKVAKKKGKPYAEWRPKGVVPIKSKLIKAVDAEIQRTMKPRSNTVNTDPEQIATKLHGLFGGADLFNDPRNPLPEVTEAFNQLVRGGPLFQLETSGERMVRESMRNARIKAEKERLKAKVTPKARRGRLPIKIHDYTPVLSEEMGREPGAKAKPRPETVKLKIAKAATPFLRDDLKPAELPPAKEFKPGERVATPKLTQKWFDKNVGKEPMRVMNRVKGGSKEVLEDVSRAVWSSSTRLEKIHPELMRRMREYCYRWMKRTAYMLEDAEPFLKKFKKLRSTNFNDWKALDLALKNSQSWKAEEIVAKHGMTKEYVAVKGIYNEIADMWDQVGGDLKRRADYWHREIKDSKGFLKHFYNTEHWSAIEQALKNRARRAGRDVADLTDEEKAQVINTLLRGYRTQAVTLATPGAVKERLVPEVDKEIDRYYYDSGVSLVRYIREMNQAISQREFFGRETHLINKLRAQQSRRLSRLIKLKRRQGLKPGATELKYTEHISKTAENWKAGQERLERLRSRDLVQTIGGYVGKLKDQGLLSAEQERSVQRIVSGILKPKGMGKKTGIFATGVYLDTLNSFFQALTQLDEYAYSIIISPRHAIPAGIRTIARRNPVTLRDIGVTAPGVEFEDKSLKKALSSLLTYTAFRGIDVFGKEALINTAFRKYKSEARRKTLKPKFVAEMKRAFGPEYKDVIEDLKRGEITENVNYLLFNVAADRQPIAHSEMPEMYNTGGNARILYTLKTFYLKRLDFVRKECWDDMKSPKTFHRGFGKLVWIVAAFVALGAGSDALKDFIKGKAFDFADSVWNNILNFIMWSKYSQYKAETEGFGRTVLEKGVPPTKVIDAASKDVMNIAKGKDRGFELWRSVPIVGEPYYWWFGEGRRKKQAKQGKGRGATE